MDGQAFAEGIAGAMKGLFIFGVVVGTVAAAVIGGIIWAICHWLV